MRSLFRALVGASLLSLSLLAEHPVAVLETTQGNIELELYEDIAP